MSKYITISFILFLSLIYINVNGSTIFFNSSTPCVDAGICYFLESRNWIGGIIPSNNDNVIVISRDDSFVLLIGIHFLYLKTTSKIYE